MSSFISRINPINSIYLLPVQEHLPLHRPPRMSCEVAAVLRSFDAFRRFVERGADGSGRGASSVAVFVAAARGDDVSDAFRKPRTGGARGGSGTVVVRPVTRWTSNRLDL